MTALTYQFFAALCGWLEAILYALRGAESFSSNEHGGMMAQRIAAVGTAVVAVAEFHWFGPWVLLAELVPLALLFPLCHDESYNFTRLWIAAKAATSASVGELSDRSSFALAWERYRYGYQSPTTTARNDFNGTQRSWLAIAGGLALAGIYLVFIFWK